MQNVLMALAVALMATAAFGINRAQTPDQVYRAAILGVIATCALVVFLLL